MGRRGPKPGSPKVPGSGRKPGTVNKQTASVKDALIQAFEMMGGVESLFKWGKANPRDFYPMWVRLLPADVKAELTGQAGGPMVMEVRWKEATDSPAEPVTDPSPDQDTTKPPETNE